MKWEKKGLLFAPDKKHWWKYYYGMMPTPELIEEKDCIRIYFGVTDKERNGRITFMDVDANNPCNVLHYSDDYIIDIGEPGNFDDSGAIPSSVLNLNGETFLYYVGFQRCEKVPYLLFSGLAKKKSTDTKFKKYSSAPIIDRNKVGHISNAAPFVFYDENKFKMWYWLGKEWVSINNKPYIKAEIFYAESSDGIKWDQFNLPCIQLDNETEFSLGRPWIIKEDRLYKMWYSIRYKDKLYRLGYAESTDGIKWTRKDDKVGIDVSETGWDSQMICYPSVIKSKGKTYLFYNGNNNGETGFGFAELIEN